MHDFDTYPKLPRVKARKERKVMTVLSLRKAGLLGAPLGSDARARTGHKKSWRVPFAAALVTQPMWRRRPWEQSQAREELALSLVCG